MGRCTGVLAQLGGERCDAGVIRPGEGCSGGGGSARGEGAACAGELLCRDPTPIEGSPSNTHCTVRPSSKASKLTTSSESSILRSTSEGSCPPFAF